MDRLERIKSSQAMRMMVDAGPTSNDLGWLISEVESLRTELKEYQQAKKDWLEAFASEDSVRSINRLAAETVGLRRELAEMREAIQAAMNELGVPHPGYPAPVANAVEILAKALKE